MIERRIAGPCTHLRLARPDKKNALNIAMYAALADALDEAAVDPATRVVTIAGGEGVFTAGNDLADFLAAPPIGPGQPVLRFIGALASFPKLLVAGVAGPAVGIGTTMLLHCDLVIATPSAQFSMPFVDLGLVPEAGSSLLLPRLIGRRRAARHLLLCEPFDAETAMDYGLVTRIVGETGLEAALVETAERLAAKPPEALLITKRLLAEAPGLAARIEEEGRIFAERVQSAEARAAFSAFFEKRPARG
jgi:enoyl-CoA hydratase/carnithine racemase